MSINLKMETMTLLSFIRREQSIVSLQQSSISYLVQKSDPQMYLAAVQVEHVQPQKVSPKGHDGECVLKYLPIRPIRRYKEVAWRQSSLPTGSRTRC
jgi:hypothetical protein